MLAGVTTPSERGERITKRKSGQAIDGLIALAMAVERVEQVQDDDVPALLVRGAEDVLSRLRSSDSERLQVLTL